jgi:hypothetical protein
MARIILFDAFHLTVYAPRGLPDPAYVSIRRTLDDRRFQADLRRAVRSVFRRYPALAQARVRVTR